MKKNFFIILGMAVALLVAFYAGVLYGWISSVEIKVSKDYAEIFVSEDEVADKTVFLEPTGKYRVLGQIDESLRKTIALYMEANNLKLCSGKHKFNRISGTLDEYLNNDFKFERIE